jgi:hypothetical protein|tara:strand:+ start:880 stop:981 length:102 start_codon:yes stop_codon:yes gene_type:complete
LLVVDLEDREQQLMDPGLLVVAVALEVLFFIPD